MNEMKRIKVLVVDDSSLQRTIIGRYSGHLGVEVVATASNAQEAMEMFRLHAPDVVTMDLTMAGWQTDNMGGIECIEAMIAENPMANILVISALTDKSTGIKALLLGARGFLTKPFNEEDLYEKLRALCVKYVLTNPVSGTL